MKLMFGVMALMLSQETSERDANTAVLPTCERYYLGDIALPWPCQIMGHQTPISCAHLLLCSRVKEGFDVAVKIW